MNETKFNGMGEIYAKYRPTYAKSFIEYLYTDIGFNKDSIIADVGSGTGILTKQLLNMGSTVYAIEPNDDMRAIAENNLSSYNNFVSVNSSAESMLLDDNSIDFITVAQAFHWFDKVKFKEECKRVLRSGGMVILVWNSRVYDDDLVMDCDNIHNKYCPNFKGFEGGMRGAEEEGAYDSFFSGDYDKKVYHNDQPPCDLNGFIGRNLSASYALKEDDDNYPAYVDELITCFNKHAVDGKLVMPQVTKSYIGYV